MFLFLLYFLFNSLQTNIYSLSKHNAPFLLRAPWPRDPVRVNTKKVCYIHVRTQLNQQHALNMHYKDYFKRFLRNCVHNVMQSPMFLRIGGINMRLYTRLPRTANDNCFPSMF